MKKYKFIITVLLFTISSTIFAQKEPLLGIRKIKQLSNFEPVFSFERDFSKEGKKKEFFEDGNVQYLYIIKQNTIDGIVKEYYKNGSLKLSGEYKNNIKVGEHKTFFEDGKTESTSYYKNGDLIKATVYFNNGKIKKEAIFTINEKGDRQGSIKEFFFSKKRKARIGTIGSNTVSTKIFPEKYFLISEFNYNNDIPNGIQKKFTERGKKDYTQLYVDGKIKEEVFYFKDGSVSIKKKYRLKNYVRDWLFYHSNGNLKNHYTQNYDDISIDSIFFENGKLKKVSLIDDNFGRILEKKEFFENGLIKERVRFNQEDGKMLELSTFFENGKQKCKSEVNGDKELSTCFYENGNIESKNQYFKNKSNGQQEYFFENGNIKKLEFYENGKKNGEFKLYFNNKQLHQIRFWENGKLMNVKHSYDKNGKKLDIGTLKNGNGTLKYYHEDGELKLTKEYKDGKFLDSY